MTVERIIAALVAAKNQHALDAMRAGAGDGDPSYRFGHVVGVSAGLDMALRIINKLLAEEAGEGKKL